MNNLNEILQNNAYPGRGIVMGRSADGRYAVMAYFIMGRSNNSRNRVFVPVGDGLQTKAFAEAKLEDPSLIIYAPVRVCGGKTIVTNGDQTDTVYDFLQRGESFEDALRTRTFEPDAPNFTPRISAMLEGFDYRMSILKSAEGDESAVRRFFYEYPAPKAGEGHFIHTYRCDGSPIPSFEGEPEKIAIEGDIDAFTQMIWQSLNAENKVSLFTRFVCVETGEAETRIQNKMEDTSC